MKYKDRDYADGRLRYTFIFHNESLLQVLGVAGDRLICETLRGRQREIPLKDADLSPPTLGYINHSDSCCSVVRGAFRRDWRQGMRRQNLSFFYLPYETEANQHTLWRGIEKTANNNFPNFKAVVAEVEETAECRAFSRCFAVNADGDLHYKSRFVAGKVVQDNRVKLTVPYLKETLEESLKDENVLIVN